MQTDKDNTPKGKTELGTDIIEALQEATDKEKKSEIVCSTIITRTNKTKFLVELNDVIAQYQNINLEVEIQYSKDNANFTALVIGRK